MTTLYYKPLHYSYVKHVIYDNYNGTLFFAYLLRTIIALSAPNKFFLLSPNWSPNYSLNTLAKPNDYLELIITGFGPYTGDYSNGILSIESGNIIYKHLIRLFDNWII